MASKNKEKKIVKKQVKKNKKVKRAVMIQGCGKVSKALGLLLKTEKVKTYAASVVYNVVTFEASEKVFNRYINTLDANGFKFDILDADTYMLMLRKRSERHLKEEILGWKTEYDIIDETDIPVQSQPDAANSYMAGDKVIYNDTMFICKEVNDGKNVSEGIGVRGEALNTEKIDLPADKNGSLGGEDGCLPDADSGRSTCSGEEPVDTQVEVPDKLTENSEFDYDATCMWLTVDEYSEKYKVPTRTIRNWAKKGTLRSNVRYGIGCPTVITVEDTRDHCPWKPDITTPIARSKAVSWEWIDWTTYCQRRFGAMKPFGYVKYDD